MKPIGKYIIIVPIEEEHKTDSGILLSASDVDHFRYKKGKVIKSGSEVSVINDDDIIYYDKNAGHSMLLYDKPYTIIQERDVVVVL
jgi:co-chaperonin GroES (HSP10)|tara:strand:- start:1359 stop:1616 length:258 start_codon:yes stop_codon:yes gene_type:complete